MLDAYHCLFVWRFEEVLADTCKSHWFLSHLLGRLLTCGTASRKRQRNKISSRCGQCGRLPSAIISHRLPVVVPRTMGIPDVVLTILRLVPRAFLWSTLGAFVWMPLGCAELSICFCHRKLKLRIRLCQLLNMFLKPRSQSAGTCWNHRIPSVLSIVQFVTIHSINKAIQRYDIAEGACQHTAGLPHQAEQEGVQHRLKSLEQVGLGDRSWIP